MNAANAFAGTWAPNLWRASWQGGLFIFAIWLICRVFKGLPASAKYGLWWLASLQMLIRLAMLSPIALPILPTQPVASGASLSQEARPEAITAFPNQSVEAVQAPVTASIASANPTVEAAPANVEAPVRPTPMLVAMICWLVGVATCFAISLKRLSGTRKFLRGATPISSGPLFDLVQEISIDHGIRQPRLLESPKALCPLLAGWIRPAIVLPSDCEASLSEAQIRMAVAHEFAHLQRRDLWLGIVPAMTQSFFFFHPLAWLATHEGAAARETACDSDALRISGGSPAAYARLLLDTAQSRSSMAVLGTAFGYRLIQRRISMLKTLTASNTRRYRTAGTLIIALSAICALPWTVTAQNPVPTAPAKQKVTKKHAKPAVSRGKKTVVAKSHMIGISTRPASVPPARLIPPTAMAPGYIQKTAPLRSAMIAPPLPRANSARAFSITPPAPVPVAPGEGLFNRTTPSTSASSTSAAPPRLIPPQYVGEALATVPSTSSGAASVAGPTPSTPLSQIPIIGNFFKTKATPSRAPVPVAIDVEENVKRLNDNVKVHFDHIDLHKALQQLLGTVHADYVINSEVEKDTVTCSLSSVSPEVALRTILKAVKQHLSYRVENGVYTIFESKEN